jgi:hypothetical protein
MGLFKEFATDQRNETEGVWVELGDTVRLKLKRAGGANKDFENMQTEKMKPFQRRIRASGGSIPNNLLSAMRKINLECFVSTVICGWQTKMKEDGKAVWVDGIEGFKVDEETGKRSAIEINEPSDLWPVTEANMRKALEELPDFFDVVADFASDAAAFREEGLEAMEGNS